MTMGFNRDEAHGAWQVNEVWWFKDDRMDAGIDGNATESTVTMPVVFKLRN
jgi:hypothetical protein